MNGLVGLVVILAAALLAIAAWLWMLSGDRGWKGPTKPPEDEGGER